MKALDACYAQPLVAPVSPERTRMRVHFRNVEVDHLYFHIDVFCGNTIFVLRAQNHDVPRREIVVTDISLIDDSFRMKNFLENERPHYSS
jgi:hypothetical protein